MAIDKVKLPNGNTENIQDSRIPGVDSTPTANSANLVTSGGVKSALGDYLTLTGGTLNSGSSSPTLTLNTSAADSAIKYQQGGLDKAWIGYNAGAGVYLYNSIRSRYLSYKDDGSLLFENNKVWHAGNDGSGSGLDADLLDGLDSVSYLHKLSQNIDANSNSYGVWSAVNASSSSVHYPSSYGTLLAIQGSYTNYKGQLFIRPDVAQLSVRGGSGDNWWDWKTVAFTDSNIASATKLQTSRSIWGQSFDGSADISGYMSGMSGLLVGESTTPSLGTMEGATALGINSATERYGLWEWVTGNGTAHLQSGRGQGGALSYPLCLQELGGNVGIGTPNPSYKLDVIGIGSFNGAVYANLYNALGNKAGGAIVINKGGDYFGIGAAPSNVSDLAFGLTSDAAGTWKSTFGVITNNGDVGIGTSSPSYKLDVNGAAVFGSAGSADGIWIRRSGGGNIVYRIGSKGTRGSDADTLTIQNSSGTGATMTLLNGLLTMEGGITTTLRTSQPSGGMLPNREYKLGTLSSATTFTLAAETSGVTNHYFWTFETGSTAPSITWPSAITSWAGGSAPSINSNRHYEVSVLNGVAVVLEV